MPNSELTSIQTKIMEALDAMKDKALVTEANLAKKTRALAGIEGKNKAGIGMEDLEKVLEYFSSNNGLIFSATLNSANEFLLKKTEIFQPLGIDAKKRRQSSEKSKSILTDSDLNEKKSSKKSKALQDKKKIRTKTEKLNIYANFDEMDD